MLNKSPERQVLKQSAKLSSKMYDWLRHLAGRSRTFSALGIATAVLYWKERFKDNPLYEQVTSLLSLRGSEIQCWFPTADHNLPIEEELAKLQITPSNFWAGRP